MMHETNSPILDNKPRQAVCLIGAGTVGRAILREFLRHDFDVILCDVAAPSLDAASREMTDEFTDLSTTPAASLVSGMPAIWLSRHGRDPVPNDRESISLVIESIPENLSMKQALFAELGNVMPRDTVLSSNTSNLRIGDVFASMTNDARCCGLHFFMPVGERPLVEFIRTGGTSASTQARCERLARQIGKATLVVKDSPGFVVNRLLVPYLNQAFLLLERGISATQLADAADRFGMPLSPLALVDAIGIRTAFDSGRIFWQSFPERLDPAPILPGMIKAGRLGRSFGGGFFGASNGSKDVGNLHPAAEAVIAKYQRDHQSWSGAELTQILAIPMWIEAAEVLATGVVDDFESVELAMRCGLGFQNTSGFFGFFDYMGIDTLRHHLIDTSKLFRGLRANGSLVAALDASSTASEALRRYMRRECEV